MAMIFGGTSGFLGNRRLLLRSAIMIVLAIIIFIAFFSNRFTSAGLWVTVAVTVVFMVGMRIVGSLEKDESRFDNGIIGERTISRELEKLPDQYVVFRGLLVNDHQDIDCTVVGPTGVFAVEVKSHKGTIGFDGKRLMRNGRPFEKDFFHETMSEAVALRDLLDRTAKLDIFVEPIIVFSSNAATVRLGPGKTKNCYVIGKRWLNGLIAENGSYRIDPPTTQKIANALALAVNDKHKEEKLALLSKLLTAQNI